MSNHETTSREYDSIESTLSSSHQRLIRFLEFVVPPSRSRNLSKNLLKRFHHMNAVFNADTEALLKIPDVTPKLVAYIQSHRDLFYSCLEERMEEKDILSSPSDVRGFLKYRLGWQNTEIFYAVFLDNANQVIRHESLFQGTVDRCQVFPREIVKKALLCSASHVILAHNHPGGSSLPSHEDRQVSKKVADALSTVAINLHDHFIVTSNEAVSMKEKGFL